MDDRVEAALKEEAQTKRHRAGLLSLLAEGRLSAAEWYAVLERYYRNNGLYDSLAQLLRISGVWMQGMKPLRNPANRAVEFHVSHLWPGTLPRAMPISAKKPGVVKAINQVWEWSNWGTEKQLTARKYANLGDLFIKVPTHLGANGEQTQVFLQVLEPANVIDFKKDARSFLTYIRIDTFQMRVTEEGSEQIVRTEVWDKPTNSYRIYLHSKGKGAALKELGDPTINKSMLESFGFDFLPFVHAKFRDVGAARGDNCYVHALDKIDEANMMATRLHQILFRYNKPTTAVMANSEDSSGRPVPPPTLVDRNNSSDETAQLAIGDEDLWELPGYSKIEYLVPNLQYGEALQILQDQVVELEADLPEILYYQLKEKGDLSGKALQTILSGAIDRALEARGNAESALVRAQQMALTIGQLRGIKGFEDATIGTYENGDFVHSFLERDVVPLSKQDQSDGVKTDVDSGMSLVFAMKRYGFTDEEIAEVMASEEYKLRLEKLLWEASEKAVASGIALETYLRRHGWTNEQLADVGTQKIAAIKARQEDRVPPVRQ